MSLSINSLLALYDNKAIFLIILQNFSMQIIKIGLGHPGPFILLKIFPN